MTGMFPTYAAFPLASDAIIHLIIHSESRCATALVLFSSKNQHEFFTKILMCVLIH